MVVRKSPDEIERMAVAGALLAEVNEVLHESLTAGMTTQDLEDIAQEEIRKRDAKPSFPTVDGWSHALCVSIGPEIVHGIPSPYRVVRDGDLISLDCGLVVDGFHSDAACTWTVGDVHGSELSDTTNDAMWAGIRALAVGNRLGDVSHAIQSVAERRGFGVIAEHDGYYIGGHGIGTSLHEEPMILGRGRPGRGMRLKPGLVFAIEPMLCAGKPAFRLRPDGWTLVTLDGSLAAHWEHTVAITEDGPWVLTARPGEEAHPAPISAVAA
jgi:methionyl aminopeptidase